MEINKEMGLKIKGSREAAGLSQVKFADLICVSQNHISQVESGKKGLSKAKIKKAAEILGTTVAYLMGEAEQNMQLKDDGTIEKGTLFIKVISDDIRACCGEGNLYPDNMEWEVTGFYPVAPEDLIGYTWQANIDDFAIIRADNDSMEPHIYEGQRLLFVKCPVVLPVNGDFVLLQWSDRLMVRGIEFIGDSKINLIPANKKYEPINTYRGDSRLCILGKIIGEATGIRKLKGMW